MPVLQLHPRNGGPGIFYSEKSLKNLAINDSTYLMRDIYEWAISMIKNKLFEKDKIDNFNFK